MFYLRQRQARKNKLSKAKLTKNQFWNIVRKVAKKAGDLTAVKDKDRNLHKDFQRIEEMVLDELAKIFSGQTSNIFASRNERLIREVLVKEDTGWQDWIPIQQPERKYE